MVIGGRGSARADARRRLTRHILRQSATTPSPDPFPIEGKGESTRSSDCRAYVEYEIGVRTIDWTVEVDPSNAEVCFESGRPERAADLGKCAHQTQIVSHVSGSHDHERDAFLAGWPQIALESMQPNTICVRLRTHGLVPSDSRALTHSTAIKLAERPA